MKHLRTITSHFFSVGSAFLFGVGVVAALSFFMTGTFSKIVAPVQFASPLARGNADSLEIDLETRTVTLFRKGVRGESLKIVSLPEKESVWELARGSFRVEVKEDNHHSQLARGDFPQAVSFGGNFFMHGPRTVDEKARRVGGVELSLADARTLFSFARTGMSVYVTGEGRLTSAHAGGVAPAEAKLAAVLPSTLTKKELLADAYLVGDLDTGEVLASEHADLVRPMASVSKLFTALTAKQILASSTPSGSAEFGLSYRDLFYPMLMQSNNEAANELARLGGGKAFLSRVNGYTAGLGLAHTHLADPSGLSPKNVSTANDLFVLAREIYAHHSDILALTRLAKHGSYENKNSFIRTDDPRYLGGKIGYTPEAGQTWVAFFALPLSEFKTKHVAVVLLRSPNRLRDAKEALARIENALYQPGAEGAALAGSFARAKGEEKPETTLLFVGDLMLDRGVKAVVEKRCSGDYSCLFENAGFLKTADITFGNLEGPLSDKGYDLHTRYSFRMEPEALGAIRAAGFDALSVANNHAGDWGRPAFEDTIARLRNAGIGAIGSGLSSVEAKEPVVLERNKIRFGFLGFSDVGPEWLADPKGVSVLLSAKNEKMAEIVKKAKEKADVLIVSFHWGEEYAPEPTERQRALAHAAIDAGADIVVGHHPHVREPIEQYGGGVIDYSLGNFIFDQSFSEKTTEGGVLAITFSGTTTVDISEHLSRQGANYAPALVDDYEF